MSKHAFVRAVIARALPKLSKVDAAIDYAEEVWAHLSARGHGSRGADTPRESIDYYACLDVALKSGFDRFWRAFHRQGDDKQGAARRWAQLAERAVLTDETVERIIAAAQAEADRPRADGEVRVMARRWLYERRWEGYSAGRAKDPDADRAQRMRELAGDLAHLKSLRNSAPYDGLEGHIEDIQQRLRALRDECAP